MVRMAVDQLIFSSYVWVCQASENFEEYILMLNTVF